jgi:hypothetical protein
MKDIETPSTIARGLILLFPADVASTAGRSGKMHGDRTLRIPAPNAVRGGIVSYMIHIYLVCYFWYNVYFTLNYGLHRNLNFWYISGLRS